MVLAELGGQLRESLRKLHGSSSDGSAGITKEQLNTLLSDISRALIESDVNVKLVMSLRDNIKKKVEALIQQQEDEAENRNVRRQANYWNKLVQKAVVDELVALVSPSEDGSSTTNTAHSIRRGRPNVVLFVGLQGSGKTTTIAKYANYYQRRGYSVAMVCADTFRAGAFDQLKQNATKLRIPFYGSYTQADPVAVATAGVQEFASRQQRNQRKAKGPRQQMQQQQQQRLYEVILVDTSGRHRQETALLEEMQEISAAVQPDLTVLVVDATQGQAVYDQALAFHNAVPVGAVIVTKLDGHAKGGGALSAVAATQSPILFTGSGEHFDDLDPFDAHSFVSKLLGFGDVRGLMEAMKSVVGGDGDKDGKDSKEELMEKFGRGEFTLRDMYKQFEKVMNMGPLNKLMGMMPGMPEYLIPKGDDQEATHRLRKFMVMMDSMNNAELDGRVDLHDKCDPKVEQRIRRIAAGSGSHPQEVKMLLQVHKQLEGMASKVGKSGLVGKKAQAQQAQMAAQMRKNPALIQQRLNQMDPKMLQQMGGRDNVMAMMQQMAKGGGPGAGGSMPNMEALMGGGGMAPPGMAPPGAAASMPGMPAGMPAGMDMQQMMQMAQQMGLGGMGGMGGAPPGPR